MRFLSKLVLVNLLYFTAFSINADNVVLGNERNGNNDIQKLVKYFTYFGGYLGYDVTKSPTDNNITVSQTLINLPVMQLAQTYLVSTFLGAIPVNAFNTMFAKFVPDNNDNASINNLANTTFTAQNYNKPSQNQIGVNPLIDQETYQPDPINQGVLNILATPSYTYCRDKGSNQVIEDCSFKTDSAVSLNVIGTLPNPIDFFSYDYLQNFLSQLNSNALTGPLLYSTESQNNGTTGANGSATNNENKGLTAQNQAQLAANFIRYASGAVKPLRLPKLTDYDALYSKAIDKNPAIPAADKDDAQNILSGYITSLRVYAAQNSVSLSNLYYIMSKRLPQSSDASSTSGSSQGKPMSQAVSEYNLATWRLFKKSSDTSKNQWINQIDQASSVTVEKEIAMLLAEINYQLYLDRQIQERILLTNSIMLLQNARLNPPDLNPEQPK